MALLLSNIKKESMSGLSTLGMVSGKFCVKLLIDLIKRYLYSFVVAA